jgi:hypothetical protein
MVLLPKNAGRLMNQAQEMRGMNFIHSVVVWTQSQPLLQADHGLCMPDQAKNQLLRRPANSEQMCQRYPNVIA